MDDPADRTLTRMLRGTAITLLLVAAAHAPPASAQPPATAPVRTADPYARGLTDADFPRVKQLADGVYSYEQLRSAGSERFTTVSLFVITPEGVLVADGQGNAEETARLVTTIAGLTDRPITHVVICSDHGDHTGGNSAFPAAVSWFVHPTSATVLAGGRGGRGLAPPPMEHVPDRRVLQLGGTEIQILFLGRAHTGGDLVVYLPRESILFMSEAFLHRVFPAMRSAYPSEWVAMIDRALALDASIYVPGHGFVDEPEVLRAELVTSRRALVQVIAEAKRLHAAGRTVDQAIAEARFGDLDNWSLRSSQAATAIRRVYAELNGELNR